MFKHLKIASVYDKIYVTIGLVSIILILSGMLMLQGTGYVHTVVADACNTIQYTSHMVNINSANCEKLMELPGIGKTLAERIINYRNKNGHFSDIRGLLEVSGIGIKKYEAIMDLIEI